MCIMYLYIFVQLCTHTDRFVHINISKYSSSCNHHDGDRHDGDRRSVACRAVDLYHPPRACASCPDARARYGPGRKVLWLCEELIKIPCTGGNRRRKQRTAETALRPCCCGHSGLTGFSPK